MTENLNGRVPERRNVATGLIVFAAQRRMEGTKHDIQLVEHGGGHIGFSCERQIGLCGAKNNELSSSFAKLLNDLAALLLQPFFIESPCNLSPLV
jgi:hypothetical protein